MASVLEDTTSLAESGHNTPDSRELSDAERKALAAKQLEVSLQMEQADARAKFGRIIRDMETH